MPSKLTKRLVDTLEPREMPYEVRDSVLPGFLVRVRPSGITMYRTRANTAIHTMHCSTWLRRSLGTPCGGTRRTCATSPRR